MTYTLRCSNCLTSHTGNHPHLCTICRKALQDRGVACNIKMAPARVAWWNK